MDKGNKIIKGFILVVLIVSASCSQTAPPGASDVKEVKKEKTETFYSVNFAKQKNIDSSKKDDQEDKDKKDPSLTHNKAVHKKMPVRVI
jgi:hypothetical protein